MSIKERYFIAVAVPRPLFDALTYEHGQPLVVGVRVEVPLGRKTVIGVVVACSKELPEGDYTVKAITRVLDEKPVIDSPLMGFLRYVARYYQHPLGEVLSSALPNRLNHGAANDLPEQHRYFLTEEGRAALDGKLGKKQQVVLARIAEGETDEETLKTTFQVSPTWLAELCTRGWLRKVSEACAPEVGKGEPGPALNADQQQALETLTARNGFSVTVLEGVTGSGKTEVYLRWIETRIQGGGQVLLLAPEIGLAEMLFQRLRERLNCRCVQIHSGISEVAKLTAWQQVAEGLAQVLVGTRSALFARFADLRAIIVDESHDRAYKQQDGLRYHATDMAVVRGQLLNVPVVLGSATPALESYYQVEEKRWSLLRLPQRVRAERPAQVTLDDLNVGEMSGGLSHRLINEIRRHLQAKQQVMLFLNRRGYAPVLHCDSCGWESECEACDRTMTAHTHTRELICHHCGRRQPLPVRCPACQQNELVMLGMGTQRLEQTLRMQFPTARVLRVDSDGFSTAQQFQQAIAQVHRREVDILLGTQWLSKGHHFSGLQLVAVVDADQAFYSSDFRAEERLAQLLVQVGGRAGRESRGHIWVQTRQPNHPVFAALNRPYRETAERLMAIRKTGDLPPYSAQALLYARHRDDERAAMALRFAREGAKEAGIGVDWLWLGPAPALIARKDGQHRWQMVIQAANRAQLQRQLPRLNQWLIAQGKALSVRVGMDIDPQWME